MGTGEDARAWWRRLLRVRPGEARALTLSAAFFFFVLFGYSMIRPVREAMGVEHGIEELRRLFYITAGASLVVAMVFGTLVHRFDRRRFIPIGFRAVIGCLLVFAALRLGFGDEIRAHTGRVFYVWLSVANLFLTSVFWAFMADTWSLTQSKRLFPVIGVGGTLGALAGSSVPSQLGEQLGPVWLLVLSGVIFECAVRCMLAIDRHAGPTGPAESRRAVRQTGRQTVDGIGLIDGMAFVARSPYLLGAAAYIALIAVSSTLIYFTQARLVAEASGELERRIAIFAQLDLLTQSATLLVQLFITGRLIRWIGVGLTLCALPVVTVAGFTVLTIVQGRAGVEAWQVFAVFALFQAIHRAGRYAVARPTRETLFSVLTPDEKYKAKTVVDLVGYRGGDVAGARFDAWLMGAGLAIGGVTLAFAPIAAVWIGLGVWLGVAQHARSGRSPDENETAGGPAGTAIRPAPGPEGEPT